MPELRGTIRYRAIWSLRDPATSASRFASELTFAKRDEALDYATRRGIFPAAVPTGVRCHDPVARDDMVPEDQQDTDTILRANADHIRIAIATLARLGICKDPKDPDPRKWSRFARGMVAASLRELDGRLFGNQR